MPRKCLNKECALEICYGERGKVPEFENDGGERLLLGASFYRYVEPVEIVEKFPTKKITQATSMTQELRATRWHSEYLIIPNAQLGP